MTTLADLMEPRSIAIVGASDDARRIGGRPLSHMINQRFEGAVYPVNPNRAKVQGLDAYPTLTDVPGDVDFVLVAVPAPAVLDVVRAAAAKKARTVLIFSSGFAETGPEGAAQQQEMAAIAKAAGTRIIGPNCLGLFNSKRRFYPTFTSTIDRATPVPGGVSIASQSGAYGSHIYFTAHQRGLGIGYFLTTGNEADLHVAEAIRLLAVDDDVHTIMAYAESVKDGPALVDALEVARANRKPVVFMKVGRSAVGAEAASSHTASLAGEDAVYDAVLKEGGAHRVRSTEEMLDIAAASRPRIYPTGKRLGIVTISGGAGVLMADAAEDEGLDVSPMPEDAQAELKAILPFASPRNPVDVTAQFFNDLSLIERFTNVMLDRGGYDGLVSFWTSVAGSPILAEPLLASVGRAMEGREGRLFIQSVVATPELQARYEELGFPCFEDPTRAVGAMATLMRFGEAFAKVKAPVPPLPALPPLPEGALGEREAKAVLAGAGLPMVEDALAGSAAEAVAAAERFGRPVALKIASADILHKTEAGGVRLGVEAGEVGGAFEAIVASARAYAPEARLDGVLVSPMADDGVELILGARVDPVFGPVVMVGLGGILAEVMKDTVLRLAPLSAETAAEMLDQLQGKALLDGVRGKPAVDRAALVDAIVKLGAFAAVHKDVIDSVEMNPVRALPQGCIALDALIVRREA